MNKKFFNNYFNDIYRHLTNFEEKKLKIICKKLKNINKNNKIIIAGNGGSASIANHVATDFTKISKIRSTTFNEFNLITCFANDYGYEKWVSKGIENLVYQETYVY